MAQHRHEAHHHGERKPLDEGVAESSFDTPDPTYSETRRRVTESPPEARRGSMRPTPFGPPRSASIPPQSMLSPPPTPKSPSTPPTAVPEASDAASFGGDAITGVTRRPGSIPPAAPGSVPPAESASPARFGQESGVSPRPTPPLGLRAPDVSSPSARTRVPKPVPELGGEKPPSFKADVEELLPLPDATQSLPRIPLAAVFPLGTELEKKAEGRSLFQVLAFALVLLASALPVLRYTGVLGGNPPAPPSQHAPPAASAAMLPSTSAPTREPEAAANAAPALPAAPAPVRSEAPAVDPVTAEVTRIEATLPSSPDDAADALVAASLHALDRGEERLAETLLARALKLDDQNPRAAYALARIRLTQNNLEGAEGWVLAALRLRPRRAEYHALYADILAKQGHASHAKRERRKARSLRD